MQEPEDNELLKEYVTHGSDAAFSMLVARHVDKVYSVAFRHTGNRHHAEEITQAVFVILAQKARHLGKGVVLSGWLYHTARFTAVTFIRSEVRRARREEEGQMRILPDENESDVWPKVAPLLDAGMAGLSEKDRHAVVLRFFDGRSMRDVGAALGANESAAKKRVNRAVEKLRRFFAKRGVMVPVTVLTAAISANSVQAAPAELITSISVAAAAKGSAAGASTVTLAKGALKLMAWTKAKIAIATVGTAVFLATGTAVVVSKLTAHGDGAARVLLEFDWAKLWNEGRLLGGEVMQLDGKTVLKLQSTSESGVTLPLFHVLNPPISAMDYAVTGEMKYDVQGVGHLAMWNFFPPLEPGAQEPQYYSFTGEDSGPTEKIYGVSDWREFSLPLDRTGRTYPSSFTPRIDPSVTAKAPTRLEVSFSLQGRGDVYLRNVKLTETRVH